MSNDTHELATTQDLRDLAAALEATIAALRTGDAAWAETLLAAAHAMAAALARGESARDLPSATKQDT